MVNKAAVGILGVIVVASLGVGTLIGMQIAGTETTETPAETDGTNEQQTGETHNETGAENGTATDGQAANETATPIPAEQREPIPARQFDDGEIAEYIVTYVNDERVAHDEDRLTTGPSTADRVQTMANQHSVAMADNGAVAHTIDGVSTSDRYENANLDNRCLIEVADKDAIRSPDVTFESIGFTYAGQPYQDDGNASFNENESDVAQALVDNWMADGEYSQRILMEEPTIVGVGVEVTSDGGVYATVNVCA